MGNLVPVSKPHTFEILELWEMFKPIMQSAMFTNDGAVVHVLERQLETRLGVPHFVAMSSGTAALEGAVSRLFKTGSVIAVPSFTFVAVATAVARCGCTPMFVDIDPDTWTMSYDDFIQRDADGVIVANCFGVPPDRRFTEIDVPLVYDNAEGFGAHTGIFGDLDVYSFHATKVVNGAEGGGIACDDLHYEQLCRWRNFGFDGTGGISCAGTNAKMSEFHAALVSASLKREGVQVPARRRLLDRYKQNLSGDVQFQSGSSALNCVVLVDNRDKIEKALYDNGIDSRPYFYPIHKTGPFFDAWADLPNTEYVSDRALALPLWEGLSEGTVDRICEIVRGELHG